MINKLFISLIFTFIWSSGISQTYTSPGSVEVTGSVDNNSEFLQIQKGEVENHETWHIFGENLDIDIDDAGEDMWVGPSNVIPRPPDVGEQMTIVSDNSNDDVGGTEVDTVRIEYLDANGDPQTEDVATNGTSGVNTVATDIRFVNDFYSRSVGSSGVAAGEIIIHKVSTPATVYSLIGAGGNQSMVCQKMVPMGHTFYVKGWHCSEGNDKRVRFRLRSTDKHGVLTEGIFLFKDVIYVRKTSSPMMLSPISVPALSIIKVSGWADQDNSEGTASVVGTLVQD